ncbi:MAG: hypothetical protein HOY79_34155 [Streptomyces sp.]|nr:hypothetical protein [Streptomyces sp.]NUS11398.1 hypothetical protein [Streptomyces sp.]NUS23461.1 hypothetical protein [Streptomyces sp.]
MTTIGRDEVPEDDLPPANPEEFPPQLQEALRRMSARGQGPVIDPVSGQVVAVDGRLVTDTPSAASRARIRRIYDGYAGLYAPSVVDEAARLLDAYLATAAQHEANDDDGYLGRAAAEATARKHGRPPAERDLAELNRLSRELIEALTTEGLEIVPTPVRMGVGVAPVPEGPRWGPDGGLAVALYADSGWELMVNALRTTSYTIHAPATEAGAAEVARLVHAVLRGDVRDPFRR